MTYDLRNPFQAKVKFRKRISGIGSGKNVQHVVFDIRGSGMSYKCGDAVAVFPKNDINEVEKIIELLGVRHDTLVDVLLGQKVTMFTALREHVDIMNLTRKTFEWLSKNTTNANGISHDSVFDDNHDELMKSSLLEVLQKFTCSNPVDVNGLMLCLRRLAPRLYSIASSQLVYKDEIHVVVGVVNYTTPDGHERHGVASNYLANGVAVGSDTTGVFVVNSKFSLPDDISADIIMVGPGTGIAPFIGFLQELEKQSRDGKNVGKNWLFFGDRNRATDFLFEDELLQEKERGVLTRLDLAFSRDQEKKIYVQDRILEASDDVWQWISNGAYIYICGNASRMAIDVENALKQVAMRSGGLDECHADEFFKNLKKSGKFQKDVY